MAQLTNDLKADYQRRFDKCVIRPNRMADVDALVARIARAIGSAMRLRAIRSARRGVRGRRHPRASSPRSTSAGTCITVTRSLPARCRFRRAGRSGTTTVHVGGEREQPPLRVPGLRQVEELVDPGDALQARGATTASAIARAHAQTCLRPYLWSFSTHYSRPGNSWPTANWSTSRRSRRDVAVATLLRRMAEKSLIAFGAVEKAGRGPHPAVCAEAGHRGGQAAAAIAERLPGDRPPRGRRAGPGTSRHLKQVTGRFLAGDPRAKPRPRKERTGGGYPSQGRGSAPTCGAWSRDGAAQHLKMREAA